MGDRLKNLNYNEMKKEIEKFKEEIIEYFKKPNFDVTFLMLIEELKIEKEDINILQYCLDKLNKEKWIEKSISQNHFEYDPGEKLDYGGIQD